jgi:hypothetical protein
VGLVARPTQRQKVGALPNAIFQAQVHARASQYVPTGVEALFHALTMVNEW